MSSWVRRIRPASGPRELQQLRDAAQDIAEQSGHAPGKTRVVFQTVADCAIIGTAVLSGALATIHLYRALFPRHKEDHLGPEPTGGDRSPPRHRGPRATAAAADRGGYEDDGYCSR